MPAAKLHALLEEHGVPCEVVSHPHAVTANRLADVEGVSGYDIAKPVLLAIGGELAMVVVPGAKLVDLERASEVLGHNDVRLATEAEFVAVFDDCDPGAEPPFGTLYGIPTFLDEELRARPRIVCRDGSHTETVTIAMTDYLRLVQPEVVDVATGPA
jgi:Ala-tRNA(Pro) deacylase